LLDLSDADSGANLVDENAATNTSVGITTYWDEPAAGANVVHSLLDNAGGRFTIDPDTGVVLVADSSLIDFESSGGSYSITAQATDGTLTSDAADFTINIANLNPTTPVDDDIAIDEIAESAASGTPVGITAAAMDPNGPAIVFALTDNAGGRFEINASTGVVTVLDGTLLNYEDATSHDITVQASDGAGGTSTQTFTIHVINENPTVPVDDDTVTNEAAEGAANGTAVGITASASDLNGPAIVFALTDNAGGRFDIDASTGVVTVLDGTLLNYEDATSALSQLNCRVGKIGRIEDSARHKEVCHAEEICGTTDGSRAQ